MRRLHVEDAVSRPGGGAGETGVRETLEGTPRAGSAHGSVLPAGIRGKVSSVEPSTQTPGTPDVAEPTWASVPTSTKAWGLSGTQWGLWEQSPQTFAA